MTPIPVRELPSYSPILVVDFLGIAVFHCTFLQLIRPNKIHRLKRLITLDNSFGP